MYEWFDGGAAQESSYMPKAKYDHPIILKGAVQIFAHLVQKEMSTDLQKVISWVDLCFVRSDFFEWTIMA